MYGVIGMLERIRDPRSPPGVALPGAALRADVAGFPVDCDELSASRRRNCSLFMVDCGSQYGRSEG